MLLSIVPLLSRGGGTMLVPDAAYEAYVESAGVDGVTDWPVYDLHSCRDGASGTGSPCSGGWVFPSSKYAPSALPFNLEPPARIAGPPGDPNSIFAQFE
mmetsp:Transcript_20912/g.49727  ORF Transcript_20912/g.49727 Transcript_20912/m.49727 type:complete len:99 (-) Transcript_20912:77-373(-)